MILVIDNYDSFTYNLVQYLGELGADLEVVRNDAASVDELLGRGYDRVVVSPGPCTPAEAGVSVEAMRRFAELGNLEVWYARIDAARVESLVSARRRRIIQRGVEAAQTKDHHRALSKLTQRVDLVLHQSDERRHDDPGARPHQ